ncbi:MAG: MFS transporter [Thermomicrobiales bacterium]
MKNTLDERAVPSNGVSAKVAWRFVLLIGLVSFFADMTYEGARSVTGPYLGVLGASATIVGFVAGFGELLGYGLRLASGYLSDRTGRYWPITFVGYGLNLFAVPALALTGRWEIAALLMIAERVGKAIRVPARDAMLSHASANVGHGRGFGVHEEMDQAGAVVGPLIVAGALVWRDDYKTAFAILLLPAILAILMLANARRLFPDPSDLEAAPSDLDRRDLPRSFWIYMAAAGLVAVGFADFPLIAFHFQKTSLLSASMIPIFFAIAMGVDAIAAIIFGNLFDHIGLPALIAATILSAGFAPLVFFGGVRLALIGVVLWGVGMGAQESVMRATVAGMAPSDKRGTAFGIFNTGFGVFWFAGSIAMGVLYDTSRLWLVIFSVVFQLAAIPLFMIVAVARRRDRSPDASPTLGE